MNNELLIDFKKLNRPEYFISLLQENKSLILNIKERYIYNKEVKMINEYMLKLKEYVKYYKKYNELKNNYPEIKNFINNFIDIDAKKTIWTILYYYISQMIYLYQYLLKIKEQNIRLKKIINNEINITDYYSFNDTNINNIMYLPIIGFTLYKIWSN